MQRGLLKENEKSFFSIVLKKIPGRDASGDMIVYAVSELFGSIAGGDGSNIDAVHQLFNM